jgi:hypothetical protein
VTSPVDAPTRGARAVVRLALHALDLEELLEAVLAVLAAVA